jgi:hypothetical protein
MEELLRKVGSWLFLVGILIAVIIGLAAQALWPPETINGVITMSYPWYISVLLAALGFLVGIFSFLAVGSITHERIPTFLIAALMLLGIGASGTLFANLDIVGTYFQNIATTLVIFVAPAAGLLAIRAIWDAGKSKEIEKVIPKIPIK